jgi:hypothetical protein
MLLLMRKISKLISYITFISHGLSFMDLFLVSQEKLRCSYVTYYLSIFLLVIEKCDKIIVLEERLF